MGNTCESPVNAVKSNKPKMLIGLDQKGTWPGSGTPMSPDADVAPPAERRTLTRSGTNVERGKPVVPPRDFGRGTVSRKANLWSCGYGRMEQANAVR